MTADVIPIMRNVEKPCEGCDEPVVCSWDTEHPLCWDCRGEKPVA